MKICKAIFLTMFLLTGFLFAQTLTGKVVAVKDGDTIDILVGKTTFIIRLEGVDAPESPQAFGNKAKQFASDFCFGKTVKVTYTEKDRYGRYLGKVYLDGKCLNEELLRSGMAWHYKHFNKEKKLADLEQYARDNPVKSASREDNYAELTIVFASDKIMY
jgi:micrococcal nuclease